MRRHLPRLLLTGALLSPVTLYALGLGEIRLNSALNQPFDAEIELLSPTPEELASLKVTMANQDVFSRYGIDRPGYLSNFDFSVSRGRDGKATIKVSSNRSVTEPYVTLLVEASWARGRLVREYTVLLDPPVFMPSQETPAPVTTPQSATTAEGRIERAQTPAPEQRPAPTRPAATPEPEPVPSPAAERREEIPSSDELVIASPGSEYVVQRNDTLSKIAAAANPGPRRVVNRTMIALFRANPAAFNGNINRLRAGSVLRIPEISEIEAIPSDEASSEVSRQTAEWSGGMVANTTPESERLRLVTPEETPSPPSAAPTPAETQSQRPQAGTPGAPASQDRRLEVTDPGLAQVQQNVDQTPAQPPLEETPPIDAQAPSEPTPGEEPVAPSAEAPPAQAPVPATPPPAPEPTLSERLGQYWWVVIALGLLVLVGAMVAFIRRRRAEAEDDSFDTLSGLTFEPPSERPARALAPSPKGGGRAEAFLVEGEDDAGLMKTNLEEFDQPSPARREPPREPARARGFDAPVAAAAPSARSIEETMSSDSAVRFDQQDALAEADFHMAYGLYDQAADLVKIAIDREPARRDLKLKLLEIYFVWGNRDLFLDAARDLYDTRANATAGEWDKVLIMGKQIAPDDPMFEGEGGTVDLVDVNLEGGENRVDVDLFAEPDGNERQGLDLEFTSGERRAPNATQGDELDFLLDEGGDEDTRATHA
jgi:pilus assembly protein FimV